MSNRNIERLTISSLLLAGALVASATGQAGAARSHAAASTSIIDLHAVVETAPVNTGADAADDPAIWVDRKTPSRSVIIGTNKKAGLHVYDLSGKELQFLPDGRMNNVDLRDGFKLGGKEVTLVTAGNRAGNYIATYVLDPETRKLTNVEARKIETTMAYGSCMYKSAKTGKLYYILANKHGEVEQWELFDNGAGKVDGKRVRAFKVPSQAEGCVADDELGFLYISEEAKGIWKFGAEPDSGDRGALVVPAAPGSSLTPDVEGIAIAATGPGRGYLIVSSQGTNSFAVYRRESDNAFVRSVRIVDGAIDGVSETDGLDVTTANLGGPFEKGLLVVQDGFNDGGNQNFKLVPLAGVVDVE